MGRGGTVDQVGRITSDRRPSRCTGCNKRFRPRVAEALCRICVRSIVRNPDPWLGEMERLGRDERTSARSAAATPAGA